MTNKHLPSLNAAKAQARRLRASLSNAGTEIGHSKALELVAEQHGFRDWNTLHAAIGNGPPQAPVAVGEDVAGTYLGKPFSGEILGVRALGQSGRYRITLRFDQPVNVSEFEAFEVLRRQINANIDRDGQTAERTSNGQPQLALAL